MKEDILPEVTVKKAGIDEVPIAAELVIKLLKEFNKVNGSSFHVNTKEVLTVTKELMARPAYAIFIAYLEQSPVGLISISPSFAIYNGGDFGVITEFFVNDENRLSGIGKSLLKAALDFAVAQGFRKVEVGAPMKEQWPRTTSFYLKNGFKEKGPKLRLDL